MPGLRWDVTPGLDARVLRARRDLEVTVESGSSVLTIVEGAQAGDHDGDALRGKWRFLQAGKPGARLEIRNKDDASDVVKLHGKSVAAILERRPMLRDWPGVADLLAKYEVAKKEREEQRKREDAPVGRGTVVDNQTISIESTPGRVKVTIGRTGPDGKPVTKTYEGTDLESMKAQHPELREALGGFSVHGRTRGFGPRAPRTPDRDDDDEEDDDVFGDDDDDMDDDDAALAPRTGPFGLAIADLDEARKGSVAFPTGGVVILAVRADSDAARLGLREGDVVTKVNDTLVDGAENLGRVIRALERPAPLTMVVVRDGAPVTLSATLGK
jgi:hypothetical protein